VVARTPSLFARRPVEDRHPHNAGKSVALVCSAQLASGRVRTNLRRDLTAALKARDRVAIAALRSALAAIENAEAPSADQSGLTTVENEHIAGSVAGQGAAEVQRRHLTESDLRAIVETEVHERLVAAAGYEQIGRHDHVQRLRSEVEVLSRYLPPAR
jgi:uncharacterized protein